MAPPSQATTVFVRFIPPSVNIRRHHLEDVFSQIGPIKKSSVILPSSPGGAHKRKPHGKDRVDNSTGNDDEPTTAIAASSYGFVKYTTELDAQRAAEKLNHSNLKISSTETVKLKVERASRVAVTATSTPSTTKRTTVESQKDNDKGASGEGQRRERPRDDDDDNESNSFKKKQHLDDGNPTKSSKREQQPQSLQQQDEHKRNFNQKKDDTVNPIADDDDDDEKNLKKTNRLIVRNLSFYAKKNHIRTALESQFGPILDIHIPTVNSNSNTSSTTTSNDTTTKATPVATHRGFCFVTFVHEKDAQNCLAAAEAAAAASSSSTTTTSDNNNTAPPPILIAKRPVSISRALNKTAFEHQKQQQKQSSTMSKTKAANQQGVAQKATTTNSVLEKTDSAGSSDSGSTRSNDEDDSDSDADNMKGSADDDSSSASDDESSSSDDDDDKNNDDDDDASQTSKDNHQASSSKVNTAKDEKAVGEKRTLFLRNLPFDATRHDLFQLFYKFGFISGIYLVKDKETGIPKGTAFVSFRDAQSIERALQAAASAAASSSTAMTEHGPGQQQAGFTSSIGAVGGGGGLLLNGRRIFVDLAVDKETAVTLTMDQKNAQSTDASKSDAAGTTKDRRNLYLKGEGRVDNHTDDSGHETNAWDELPESDQLKRQKAWSEKNSKLRSPLFFINPTRLSIRNLAKDVNEVALKRLCVEALQRGLENKLVAAQDQITHWKASGELSTRDILKRIESLPDEEDGIPKFEEENVRKYITSVFIDCEFGKNKKEKISRGFGFVEFEHHAHALACLRELNNNTRYTQEYAIGGKHAVMTRTRQRKSSLSSKKQKRQHKNDGDDQQAQLPRLIVEFAVENVAKAKQQAEHRALQQANMVKQKRESREKSAESKTKEKKKSRGQRQREKKRQRQEDGDDDAVNADGGVANEKNAATTRKKQQQDRHDKANNSKIKKVKPLKRQKVDQEEAEFSKLVASYKSTFTADTPTDVADDGENQGTAKKRWFE